MYLRAVKCVQNTHELLQVTTTGVRKYQEDRKIENHYPLLREQSRMLHGKGESQEFPASEDCAQ